MTPRDDLHSNAQPDRIGLCRACRHSRMIPHPRGGDDYWRCGLAETDPRFLKFPTLPVRTCIGYDPEPESNTSP